MSLPFFSVHLAIFLNIGKNYKHMHLLHGTRPYCRISINKKNVALNWYDYIMILNTVISEEFILSPFAIFFSLLSVVLHHRFNISVFL